MPTFAREFLLFGLKQASACLFAGTLLLIVIVTRWWYPFEALPRYDFLFLAAVAIQVALFAARLETRSELVVIVVFHVVATGMELFKTSDRIGAWNYPEPCHLRIGNVPLFAGFMYSAVGSYIARAWRLFDFRFSSFPSRRFNIGIAVLIYVNFFTHHYLPDLRYPLMLAIAVAWGRASVHFRMDAEHRRMPLLIGLVLVSLFIWFAENIATYARVWLYPAQRDGWQLVSVSKISAWFLLMYISFVLVSLVHRPVIVQRDAARSRPAAAA